MSKWLKFKQADGVITLIANASSAGACPADGTEYGVAVLDSVVDDHVDKVVDIASLTFTDGEVDADSVALIAATPADYLALTTDATDTSTPVNGIPDIDADGVATCTINIQKKSGADDSDMTGAGDNETVTLETDRGHLSVLSVALVNGAGSVTLKSVAETVTATITASADGLTAGSIQIQFAP